MAEWEQWYGMIFMLTFENEHVTGDLSIPVISECWNSSKSFCAGVKKENKMGATASHLLLWHVSIASMKNPSFWKRRDVYYKEPLVAEQNKHLVACIKKVN